MSFSGISAVPGLLLPLFAEAYGIRFRIFDQCGSRFLYNIVSLLFVH